MATKKISQKTIKQLVKEGAATDIDKMAKRPKKSELDLLGVSKGASGMNGALFRHTKTNKLYAITARNSTLFEYV